MNSQMIQVSPEVAVVAIGSPDLLQQLLANVMPTLQVAGADPAPAAQPTDTAKPEVTTLVTRATHTPPPRRRGRLPGTYRVIDNVADVETILEQQPQSVRHVYRVLASRKRGMTATTLAERAKTPAGTVGWALALLARIGLVQHHMPKLVRA